MAIVRRVLRRLRGEEAPPPQEAPERRDPNGADEFRKLRVAFTAAVSHELRTPLARLLALLDTADLPDADPRAVIAAARAEVAHMSELVDDLLFLSEVEEDRELAAAGSTRVLPILEEVVRAWSARADEAGIRFVVVAAPDVELPIRPRLLRTVVETLVDNVFRHAIGATRCWLSARRERDRILLSVVDNGSAAIDFDRAFERFYREDPARTSAGSGLGLAIVKHVVAAVGGTVEARPGPGGVGVEIRCTFTSL